MAYESAGKDIQAINEAFKSTLGELVNSCVREFGSNLQGILQFGSTVRQLKPATDLDLFMLFHILPSDRYKRWRMMDPIEASLKPSLDRLESLGCHLSLSPLIRTVEEAQKYKGIYLDFPDQSQILYDPSGHLLKLLDKISNFIKSSGAKKIIVGNKWYWDLKPGATTEEDHPIGW